MKFSEKYSSKYEIKKVYYHLKKKNLNYSDKNIKNVAIFKKKLVFYFHCEL